VQTTRTDQQKEVDVLLADERWLQITYAAAANPMELVIWRPMERSPLSVICVANVLVKQDISRVIRERTVGRNLLNATSVANVLVKQEI